MLLSIAGAAGAALKPLDSGLQPAGNRALPVYKTTPQGDPKIHLTFPADWNAGARRPATVFFFGWGRRRSTGSKAFTERRLRDRECGAIHRGGVASRGLVVAPAEYPIESFAKHFRALRRRRQSAIRWLPRNARHRPAAPSRRSRHTTRRSNRMMKTVPPSGPDALVLINPAFGVRAHPAA
jgi:hypothetical protein